MSIYTYTDVDVDPDLLERELHAYDTDTHLMYNGNTRELIVSSTLVKAVVTSTVNAHDAMGLEHNKLLLKQAIHDNTSHLLAKGILFNGVMLPCMMEDKVFYSALEADIDSGEFWERPVDWDYPLHIPAVSDEEVGTLNDDDDVYALVNATNDRLVYVYETQTNSDGSKGELGYISAIDACTTQGELEAVVDTRI